MTCHRCGEDPAKDHLTTTVFRGRHAYSLIICRNCQGELRSPRQGGDPFKYAGEILDIAKANPGAAVPTTARAPSHQGPSIPSQTPGRPEATQFTTEELITRGVLTPAKIQQRRTPPA